MNIDRIAERVFLASIKMAKFRINYDHININEEGIFIDLDGSLDYESIENVFDNEKVNVEALADEFSALLLKNKDIEQLKGMNIESIDKKEYRIVHDEHKNDIYMFLPMSAIKKNEEEQSENTFEKINCDEIIENLNKEVKLYEITFNGDAIVCVSGAESFALDSNHDIKMVYSINRIMEKRKDVIQSNIYLKIIDSGKIIYNKIVRNSFKINDYGLEFQDLNIHQNNRIGIRFKKKGSNKHVPMVEIKKLSSTINNGDIQAVKIFEQDISKDLLNK